MSNNYLQPFGSDYLPQVSGSDSFGWQTFPFLSGVFLNLDTSQLTINGQIFNPSGITYSGVGSINNLTGIITVSGANGNIVYENGQNIIVSGNQSFILAELATVSGIASTAIQTASGLGTVSVTKTGTNLIISGSSYSLPASVITSGIGVGNVSVFDSLNTLTISGNSNATFAQIYANNISGTNISGTNIYENGQLVATNNNLLYVSGLSTTALSEISTLSGTVVTLSNNLNTVSGIAINASGNAVLALAEIAALSGTTSILTSELATVSGIASTAIQTASGLGTVSVIKTGTNLIISGSSIILPNIVNSINALSGTVFASGLGNISITEVGNALIVSGTQYILPANVITSGIGVGNVSVFDSLNTLTISGNSNSTFNQIYAANISGTNISGSNIYENGNLVATYNNLAQTSGLAASALQSVPATYALYSVLAGTSGTAISGLNNANLALSEISTISGSIITLSSELATVSGIANSAIQTASGLGTVSVTKTGTNLTISGSSYSLPSNVITSGIGVGNVTVFDSLNTLTISGNSNSTFNQIYAANISGTNISGSNIYENGNLVATYNVLAQTSGLAASALQSVPATYALYSVIAGTSGTAISGLSNANLALSEISTISGIASTAIQTASGLGSISVIQTGTNLIISGSSVAVSGVYVPISGGTMTGPLYAPVISGSIISGNSLNISNSFSVTPTPNSTITNNSNLFAGLNAGLNNVSGNSNTAYGSNAFKNNTNGNNNVAIGFQSSFSNTSGNTNTSVGINSLYYNIQGNSNTTIGNSALEYSLESNNTAIGFNAGRSTTAAGYNSGTTNSLFVGYGTTPLTSNDTNEIVIGYGTAGSGSNTTVIGNTSTTDTYIPGNIHGNNIYENGNLVATYNVLAQTSGLAATALQSVPATYALYSVIAGTSGTAISGLTNANLALSEVATISGSIITLTSELATVSGIAFSAIQTASGLGTISVTKTGTNLIISGSSVAVSGVYVPISGGTMTGPLYAPVISGSIISGNSLNISNSFSVTPTPNSTITNNSNLFAGFNTGLNNISGNSNTAYGSNAFKNNTNGNDNVAIGYQSSFFNTSGSSNTSVGVNSLYSNIQGNRNTAIGNSALQYSLESDNTAIGFNAGQLTTAGVNNSGTTNSLFVGYGTTPLTSTDTNEIVIGYGTAGSGSNTTVIGNPSTTNTYIYGNIHGNNIFQNNQQVINTISGLGTISVISNSNGYVTLSGSSSGGVTGPSVSTLSGIAIWSSTNGSSITNSAWTISGNNLLPINSGTQNIGNSNEPINQISTQNISGSNSLNINSYTTDNNSGAGYGGIYLNALGSPGPNFYYSGVVINALNTTINSTLNTQSLIPLISGNYVLGSNSFPYSNGYIDTISANTISTTGISTNTISANTISANTISATGNISSSGLSIIGTVNISGIGTVNISGTTVNISGTSGSIYSSSFTSPTIINTSVSNIDPFIRLGNNTNLEYINNFNLIFSGTYAGVANYGCSDGTNAWFTSYNNNTIQKFDQFGNQTIINVVSGMGAGACVADNSGNIWVAGFANPSGILAKVSTATNSVIAHYNLNPSGAGLGGLQDVQWDGSRYLYLANAQASAPGSSGQIIKFDTFNNTVSGTANNQTNVNGICLLNYNGIEYIYGANTGFISQIQASNMAWINSYVGTNSAYRLCTDGQFIYTADFETGDIYKLTPELQLVGSINNLSGWNSIGYDGKNLWVFGDGILILDTNLNILYSNPNPSDSNGFICDGNYVWCSDQNNGLYKFAINNQTGNLKVNNSLGVYQSGIATTFINTSGINTNNIFANTINTNTIITASGINLTSLNTNVLTNQTSPIKIGLPSGTAIGKQYNILSTVSSATNTVTISGINCNINGSKTISLNSATIGTSAQIFSDGNNYWSIANVV